MWAEVLIGVVGCAAILGLSAFANANLWPKSLRRSTPRSSITAARRPGRPHRLPVPDHPAHRRDPGDDFGNRRRFGRYVYAYGGNPDAAELAGINTRWTILKTYVLMGVLCALAAAIASARLNGSTLDVGRATSCTSSRPPSSAGRRSRAASAPSRAPSWARSSCSRWRTA